MRIAAFMAVFIPVGKDEVDPVFQFFEVKAQGLQQVIQLFREGAETGAVRFYQLVFYGIPVILKRNLVFSFQVF